MSRAVFQRLATRLALLSGLTLPGLAAADAVPYVVQPGESLFVIGKRLLGRPDGGVLLQGWNRLAHPNALRPGQRLMVPLAALRGRLALSTVLSTSGQPLVAVTPRDAAGQGCGDSALAAGQRLPEGACIQTGARDQVALLLPDGSRLDVFPDSRVRVVRAMSWDRGNHRWVEMRLEQGRIESHTQPGSGIYRIGTPLGIAAVRGTAFGVDVQPGRMLVDVGLGRVAVSAEGWRASGLVRAGEGAVVSGEEGLRVLEQLVAPASEGDREPIIVLRDSRARGEVAFGAVQSATGYRFVVSRDDGKAAIVHSGHVARPAVPLGTLAQGVYAVQLRAVGVDGLAGQAARRRVQLLDVPDPPVLLQPPDGAFVPPGPLALRCQPALLGQAATRFEFELARDAQFAQRVQLAQRPVCALDTVVQGGTYYWRVRALGLPGGDPAQDGAFSAAAAFHAQLEASGTRLQSGEGDAAQPVSAGGQPVGRGDGVAPGAR